MDELGKNQLAAAVSHTPAGFSSLEVLLWRDFLRAREETALSKPELDTPTENSKDDSKVSSCRNRFLC